MTISKLTRTDGAPAAQPTNPAPPDALASTPPVPARGPAQARGSDAPARRGARSDATARPRSNTALTSTQAADELSAAERGEGYRTDGSEASSIRALRAFPTTIADWSAAVDRDRSRPVDSAMAASVLNEVRNKGSFNLGQSHHEAIALVEDQHVERWRAALGLGAAEVQNMVQNAKTLGHFIPSGSTIFNAANYAVLPFLKNMGSDNAFVNTGIAVGVAGVLQPLVTGLMQTPIVAALDARRQKMGHAVALDGAVNAKRTPKQIGADLKEASAQVAGVDQQIAAKLTEMAHAYGLPAAPGGQFPVEDMSRVLDALANDPDVDRKTAHLEQFKALGMAQLEGMTRVKDLSDTLRMSQGVQGRQWQSTTRQIAPRTARAASAFVSVAGTAIERAMDVKPTVWPTVAAVGTALAALAWQHYAAGVDEVKGALEIEEKLNMLYGKNFLTEAGLDAQRNGTPILAEHIDEAKFRALAAGPASQTLARVGKLVGNYAGALDAEANPAKAAEYAHDISAMRENRLADLTPGGDAQRLLHEVMGRGPEEHPFIYAAREGWQKLTTLEITAQLGQRFGLAWTGGVFGNVGATAGSRLVGALFGGAAQAPIAALLGGAALSTASGAAGAAAQFTVANVKNERRAEPDRVSFIAQLASSVVAPLWQYNQSSKASEALAAAAGAAQLHHQNFAPHTLEAEIAQRFARPPEAAQTADPAEGSDSFATAASGSSFKTALDRADASAEKT
jgi:hypothetical protein